MASFNLVFKRTKNILLNRRIHNCQKKALAKLKRNDALWCELEAYRKNSNSAGVSYSDYWELYHFVRSKKPIEILECGTGVSTMVMAHALMENEREHNITERITSMEELQEWYQMALEIMPDHLKKYVDLV